MIFVKIEFFNNFLTPHLSEALIFQLRQELKNKTAGSSLQSIQIICRGNFNNYLFVLIKTLGISWETFVYMKEDQNNF